jgi:hypothetical protein
MMLTPFPESLGFRTGANSAHTSRTMMSAELALVLNRVGESASAEGYRSAIIEDNILGKPTRTTRERSAKRLAELYALTPDCSLFRLLRHFWPADPFSQPMLAFLLAAARDTLLRDATPFVVGIKVNEPVTTEMVSQHLGHLYPKRFRPTTLRSTAQNLASSWTQAGYLRGKVKKSRVKATVTPVVTSYAILLGYLCGLRGKMLLDSPWTRLLDRSSAEILDLTQEASKQGWLRYKGAGAVVEIGFPGLLKPHEEWAALRDGLALRPTVSKTDCQSVLQ